MKLWEKVIEHRLRMINTTSETQFGYMPGRSTVEAVYLPRIEQKKILTKETNRKVLRIEQKKQTKETNRKVQTQEERSPRVFYSLRKNL